MIDAHTIAWINLVGSACTVLGALYLAYDLLGGTRGPLRTLTRVVTYSILFAAGYSIGLGLVYGLTAGAGLGLALAIELRSLGRFRAEGKQMPRWISLAFGFLRGIVQGIAASLAFRLDFGIIFGLLSAVGLVLVYAYGFSVAAEYATDIRPRLSRQKLMASIARGLVIGLAGALAGVLVRRGTAALIFGLEVGLVVGFVSALVGTVSPFIEFWADHLPERRLGALGIGITIFGFALQSIQFIVILLNIPVR